MKRITVTLTLFVATVCFQVLYAQKTPQYMSFSDINAKWKTQEITLPKNVSSPSVTQLVRAFNGVWRTEPGDMVVLKNDNPKKFNKMNSGIDAVYSVNSNQAGNYLSSIGVGDAPWMEARTWIRSNGHRFFALNISAPDASESVIVFYDFNPDNSKLVPDVELAESIVPETEVGRMSMKLPEEGDEVIINEHIPGWNSVLGTVYTWDGMNLKRGGTSFTGFTDMIDQYKEDVGEMPNDFTKFALVDIDMDGTPELWLRTDDDNDGAFFCMGSGNPKLITTENWKIKGNICEHGVLVAGSAGTGAFYAQYVLLQNSDVADRIYYNASYNMRTEDMDVEYTRANDVKMTIQEGEKATAKLGNVREVEPVWHSLYFEQ